MKSRQDGEADEGSIRGLRYEAHPGHRLSRDAFDVGRIYAALLDLDNYPRWWPAPLRVRILESTAARVGSRLEIRPRGSSFTCEISRIVPDREIQIQYVAGVHRDTGRWTFDQVAGGTRTCYQIDLEPQGWFPRLLSNFMDFGKLHSRSMAQVFDGLEAWLREREGPSP